MPEQRDELIEHFRAMKAGLLQAIDGLTPAQLTERTIDGWSVKDHLFHLAAWDTLRAAEIVRISTGFDSHLQMTSDQDEAYNALILDLSQPLSVEQALWELSTSYERLLAALEQATPRGLDASHYGEAALVSTHAAQHTGWIRRWRSERGY